MTGKKKREAAREARKKSGLALPLPPLFHSPHLPGPSASCFLVAGGTVDSVDVGVAVASPAWLRRRGITPKFAAAAGGTGAEFTSALCWITDGCVFDGGSRTGRWWGAISHGQLRNRFLLVGLAK